VALLEFLEASALSQWLVVSMAGGPTSGEFRSRRVSCRSLIGA
jgi:hypothetical protein